MVTVAQRLKEINRLANKLKTQASNSDLGSFSEKELGSLTKSVQKAEAGVQEARTKVSSRVSSGQTKEQVRVKALPETPISPTSVLPSQPKDRVSNTVAFSSALNKAVEVARKQRQSKELDFIDGKIPMGAISASTFGSLMSGLNRASTQFTEPLISDTLAAVEADRKAIEDQTNDIRDLALSLVQNGASQESIQAILNSPDIDSAIAASAGIMQSVTKDDTVVEKVGSNLVSYNPEDPQGTMRVLYSAGSGEGTSGGSTTKLGDSGINWLDAKTSDVKAKAKAMFQQDLANKIITELDDEKLRLFLNDFEEVQKESGQSLDPVQYYNEWKNTIGIETEETEEGISNPWS